MRTLLLLLLAASAAGGGPVVRESGSAHELVLPAAMRQALEAYDSSFKVWAEKDYAPLLLQEFEFTNAAAPFAVIGDFNGDTSPDVALHGVTKASEVVVVVLSGTRGSYTVKEVERYPKPPAGLCAGISNPECGQDAFVRFVPRGTQFEGVFEGYPLTLKRDAFEVVAWQKAAVMYFWRDGRFQTYTTAD